MAGSLNKVMLIGNLGADPEIRSFQNGGKVVNLRIATSRSWTDKQSGQRKEETEWHDVEVWGKQAEQCGEYLAKGWQVYVEGRLKTDKWQDKQSGQDRYRVKVVADTVLLPALEGEMIAPVVLDGDHHVVPQAEPLQVADERGARAVGVLALDFELGVEIAMLIPARVHELHKAHALLHQPPRVAA